MQTKRARGTYASRASSGVEPRAPSSTGCIESNEPLSVLGPSALHAPALSRVLHQSHAAKIGKSERGLTIGQLSLA